ncbi:hypothetical protein [Methylobrevis albus]|uniref:Nitrate reductase n=1 Tax=Methylobrevis albus TaxID=2793297 RepID=A0A931I337_9HYPH|nr:hypothetical protein [Methylobrevis albus]MBH0239357.1 hypothetical protein [Methylobrevis albus]
MAFFNPFARRPPLDAAVSQRIKDWVREVFEFPDEVVITVSEVACRDAGCPDRETLVRAFLLDAPLLDARIERAPGLVSLFHIEAVHYGLSRRPAAPAQHADET